MKKANGDDELAFARAYARYDETLRAYQAVDFDDLIALPIELLSSDPEVAAKWRERCAHLLVDEYQDTNPAQYRLLRLLAGERAAFTAVGDDDQAIYGWRGATIDNLAQLPTDYPKLKVIKLEQNYRSTVRILRSANALIANNPKLFDKKLWSELPTGDTIRVDAGDRRRGRGRVGRAAPARAQVRASRPVTATTRSSTAATTRRSCSSSSCARRTCPTRSPAGSRTSIAPRSATSSRTCACIANDDDDRAFIRAVTTPKRGVGATSLERLSARSARRAASASSRRFTATRRANALPARPREVLESFCALINGLRFRAEREPAGRLLDELVAAIDYREYLTASGEPKQADARWQSVRDFVDWLARKGEADNKNLLELTQTIALITMLEGQEDAERDAVRLSTLHAAKGLEFPHVFIVGVEEGLLPHRETIAAGNVDEERRLFYVGLTRAQRSLHLSFCRRRKRAGGVSECHPSRFLAELAQEDLRWADTALAAGRGGTRKGRGQRATEEPEGDADAVGPSLGPLRDLVRVGDKTALPARSRPHRAAA